MQCGVWNVISFIALVNEHEANGAPKTTLLYTYLQFQKERNAVPRRISWTLSHSFAFFGLRENLVSIWDPN